MELRVSGSLVYLRTPSFYDLEFIKKLWTDPITNQFTGGPYHMTDEGGWFQRWVEPGQEDRRYCLIYNEEDMPVGEVCFSQFDPVSKSARFNIKILSEHHGKKYAFPAMQIMLRYFFLELGGELMLDDIALENIPGQQALLKFGFEHDPSQDHVFLVRLTKEQFFEKYDPSE